MDIDMTAGLTKLIPATTEPQEPAAPTLPETAFAAMLDVTKSETTSPEQGDVAVPLPWPTPLALPDSPEQPLPQLPAGEAVLEAKAEIQIAVMPLQKPIPGQAASAPQPILAAPEAKAAALPTMPLPMAAPLAEKPVRDKATPVQLLTDTPKNPPSPLPVSAQPAAANTAQVQASPVMAPEVKQDITDMARQAPAKLADSFAQDASPKQTAQPAPVGGGQAEAPLPPLSNIPFSLKIENHVNEAIPAPRHQAPSVPVSSQISEQLPHLLTKAEKQTVELRLDPPELGRVTIHLTTHDQQVSAHVVAERGDTVDLMRRHTELLTATLARAGFSQADLSFQQGKSQNDQGGFQHFQGITDVSQGDDQTLPAPSLADPDGRLDIRL